MISEMYYQVGTFNSFTPGEVKEKAHSSFSVCSLRGVLAQSLERIPNKRMRPMSDTKHVTLNHQLNANVVIEF